MSESSTAEKQKRTRAAKPASASAIELAVKKPERAAVFLHVLERKAGATQWVEKEIEEERARSKRTLALLYEERDFAEHTNAMTDEDREMVRRVLAPLCPQQPKA